jgi:hypothetical protein
MDTCGFCGLYARTIDEEHVFCPIRQEVRSILADACGNFIDEEEFVMFGEMEPDSDVNDDIF